MEEKSNSRAKVPLMQLDENKARFWIWRAQASGLRVRFRRALSVNEQEWRVGAVV
jgi:hypothetical protein